MGGSRKGFGGGIARYFDMIEVIDDLRSIYERQLIALTAMNEEFFYGDICVLSVWRSRWVAIWTGFVNEQWDLELTKSFRNPG